MNEFRNMLNLDILLVSNGFNLHDINAMAYLDYESYVAIIKDNNNRKNGE